MYGWDRKDPAPLRSAVLVVCPPVHKHSFPLPIGAPSHLFINDAGHIGAPACHVLCCAHALPTGRGRGCPVLYVLCALVCVSV